MVLRGSLLAAVSAFMGGVLIFVVAVFFLRDGTDPVAATRRVVSTRDLSKEAQQVLAPAIEKFDNGSSIERRSSLPLITAHGGSEGKALGVQVLREVCAKATGNASKNEAESIEQEVRFASSALIGAGRRCLPIVLDELKHEQDVRCLREFAFVVARLLGPSSAKQSLPRLRKELKANPAAIVAVEKAVQLVLEARQPDSLGQTGRR